MVILILFLGCFHSKQTKLYFCTNIIIGVSTNNHLLLITNNMAIPNKERQKLFRESKIQAGQARVSCWLDEEDKRRLQRLMKSLDSNDKKQQGYSAVISQALKELEISLTPAPQREIVRYGLRIMGSQDQHGK